MGTSARKPQRFTGVRFHPKIKKKKIKLRRKSGGDYQGIVLLPFLRQDVFFIEQIRPRNQRIFQNFSFIYRNSSTLEGSPGFALGFKNLRFFGEKITNTNSIFQVI